MGGAPQQSKYTPKGLWTMTKPMPQKVHSQRDCGLLRAHSGAKKASKKEEAAEEKIKEQSGIKKMKQTNNNNKQKTNEQTNQQKHSALSPTFHAAIVFPKWL